METKVQLNAMPRLSPYAPSLSPASNAVPQHWSQASVSMDFLASIQQIRIAHTHRSVRDGATLYEVELYSLCIATSNIPTVRNSYTPILSNSGVSTTSSSTTTLELPAGPERQPDQCVRRRFDDFARLRHEAMAATCINAHFLCQYCRQFQCYVRFHAAQPLWVVRVVTTKKQRKKILAQFLADLVEFAQSRAQHHSQCRLRTTLPVLLEKFVTD